MNRIVVLVASFLALALAASPAVAKKDKRYGIEGKLKSYDSENEIFEVEVMRTKVSGSFGSGGVAGGPAPKSVKQGQTVKFQVVPEGSVLRRTVIKAKTGTGLDNSGTKEGFAKAVERIPRDQAVVFSFEKNPKADSATGVPEFLLKMIQVRMTEEEWEARLDSMTVEE